MISWTGYNGFSSDPDCVFEVDGIGRTALMYAVNFGHLDTVQILLENGIDVNATAHGRFCAFYPYIQHKLYEIKLKIFISIGTKIFYLHQV